METRAFVDTIGQLVDVAGVLVILAGTSVATAAAVLRELRREPNTYVRLRQDLGRAILLGLEFLVAADIIRTVAVEPTLESVAVLALIVLVRTFLSFSLEVEIDGTWPWRRARPGPEGGGA